MIPPYDENGNLPPGIHPASWQEIEAAFGDSPQRAALLAGLREALLCLRVAGCRTVYLDGSFVTAKEDPTDFDACWEAAGVDASLLDPILLDVAPPRTAQKQRFGGELFPASLVAEPKSGVYYLEFFQHDRDGKPKGIVQIDLESV